MIRLIARTRVTVVIFFLASYAVYFFVKLGSCVSWMSSIVGYAAMYMVMTVEVVRMLYIYMPKDPDAQDQILQVRSSPAPPCILHIVPRSLCGFLPITDCGGRLHAVHLHAHGP